MANYQRYQTLSSAEQYLYSPSSPVWVSRYQLSWDTQTGARLLQCRMVNVSQKAISAVYLRVLCRDAQGQDITTMHLVPMTGLYITPGEVFGDDKVVTLWPNRTAFAEIYAERVCYTDGSAWNEPETGDYVAIPAPAPVHVQDLLYTRLAAAAREGGVHNEYYFRQMKSVWQCTCGVPNSNQILYCRHCGADRSWLEMNMDIEALSAPAPKEAPALPPPTPTPTPEPPKPEATTPLEKFDLSSYLSSEPMQRPAEQEFPYIQTLPRPQDEYEDYDEDEEGDEDTRDAHVGRKIAIILAVLLFLGIGAWLAYRQLFGPYAKYQQAVRAENDGQYEEAIELYEALGDYEDSPARIEFCRAQIALNQMRDGNYEAAYEVLKDMPEFESYAADCLYSMGVLAYNNGDYDGAWDYVGRLQAEYPDYENTKQLEECCSYEYGKQALSQSEQEENLEQRRTAVQEAKSWFLRSGSYSNSADMVNLCDYYLADVDYQSAIEYGNSSAFLTAADQFQALGSYSDSAQRRLACMFAYCEAEPDLENPKTEELLAELIAADYPGAAELEASLSILEARVDVSYDDGQGEGPVPEEMDIEELGNLVIRYEIEGKGSGSLQILMVYTLPGADNGSVKLNEDDSRSGIWRIYDLVRQRVSETGEGKLQFYDSGTGEELLTVRFTVTDGSAEVEKTEGTEETDGGPDTGVEG